MTRPPLNPIDGQSIILLAPSCARNGQGDDGSGRKVTKTDRPRFPSCFTSLPHRSLPCKAEPRRSSSVRSLAQKQCHQLLEDVGHISPRAHRCLSDRDQRLHRALPCGGRTYARRGCNSMRSSLLRDTLVPCRLDPRNVGQDAVSKEDRVGFAVQKWSVLGVVGVQATTYNEARHVYKRTRIRRRFCRYGCTVCM